MTALATSATVARARRAFPALGAAIAMLAHVGDHAPHGGLIVLPVVVHRLGYLVAIAAGVLAVVFFLLPILVIRVQQVWAGTGG